MTIQTTRFELSKELKELGIKQHSYFYWFSGTHENFLVDKGERYQINSTNARETYSAFSLDEILEMLPNIILIGEKSPKVPYELHLNKWRDNRIFNYSFCYISHPNIFSADSFINYKDKNPAEAAGRLLKWCIQNGYVKPEYVKVFFGHYRAFH